MTTREIDSSFSKTDNEILTTTNKNYSQGVKVDGSSAPDVILADTSPATTTLVNDQQITVELDHASNTIVGATFQLGSTTTKVITRDGGGDLLIGDTGGSGYQLQLKYSSALDKWVLMNPRLTSQRNLIPNPLGTTGNVNQLVIGFTPAITTLRGGEPVSALSLGANTTTTPTIDFGGGARTITTRGCQALLLGDLGPAGYNLVLNYITGGSCMELANPYLTQNDQLIDDVVETDNINDLAVTGDKIAAATITEDKIKAPTAADDFIIKRIAGSVGFTTSDTNYQDELNGFIMGTNSRSDGRSYGMQIMLDGAIRLKFDQTATTTDSEVRIMKNGVIEGAVLTTTAGSTDARSRDVTIALGDYIEIQQKCTGGISAATIKNANVHSGIKIFAVA